MKLYMFPSNKKDNFKPNSFQSSSFNNSKIEKSHSIKSNKKKEKNVKNNSKDFNKKRNIEENKLNKSKQKKLKILNDNNSFNNNSLLIKSNKKEKQIKEENINNKNNIINSSRSKISFLKKKYNKNNNNIMPHNISRAKIFNNKKLNKINIINYNNIIPNIKNNSNRIRDFSGENNLNFNNNTSLNISSIDHLFYKPIKNKFTINKTNNNFLNKKSSGISPVNVKLEQNSISKSKYFPKLNTSFSLSKNKNDKSNNNIKRTDNSFIEKNHSALNIGKHNIKKNMNFKLNNYKKKINDSSFQPKNIFSKFKTKKEKKAIKEEILLNHKLLMRSNQENKDNKKPLNYNNFISKLEQEEVDNNKSNIINIIQSHKEKEIKLDGYNNNFNNSSLYIQNKQSNQNNQINSYNMLSNTTLVTGTDNQINSASQNIIDVNNNSININKYISSKGKKIRCIHDISKTGLSGEDKKVNQDRYFIFRNFVVGFENIFMGVLDGHGYYGHEVSEYIKENLPMDLNRILKTKKLNLLKDDLSQTIKQTFEMENNSLLRNKQIDSNLSGSTCVSVIYTPEKLIIANLGDSRCVLGKKINNNEWKAENLTRDHKPSIPEEAERIKSYGGRIRPMKDEDGNFIGPLRVYMKEKDLPGLAMTRSFGDYYASTAGTISIPEISEYKFVPEDKFLILASDGLFEFIESEEVVNIVAEYYEKNDIVGCCEFLYKESYRKWIFEEEDTVDDITIILVFFED